MSLTPQKQQNPFAAPSALAPNFQQGQQGPPQKQSGLGIASAAIGIFAMLSAVGVMVGAAIIGSNAEREIDENDIEAIMVGFGIIGVIGLSLLGMTLGIIAVVLPRRKGWSIAGIIINAMVMLGLCGLVMIGLALG